VAIKYMVTSWPPIWVGCTRFLIAGALLVGFLQIRRSLTPLDTGWNRKVWIRGGASLAIFLIFANTALRLIPLSHIAIYMGTPPIWALLLEERPTLKMRSIQRYCAAFLTFIGIVILVFPAFHVGNARLLGEVFALISCILWTLYGKQCQFLGQKLSGLEVTALTMWRAGLLLIPFALWDSYHQGLPWRWSLVGAQAYSILGGGIIGLGLWNSALRYWPASKVFIFNNLVPLSTMVWGYFFFREPLTTAFWISTGCVAGGLILAHADLKKLFSRFWVPQE
jgi:drug/metabolite transporter (DMT)-like permease